MKGGGKMSDFFKKNALMIFIGILLIASIIIAVLLFTKPVERFDTQTPSASNRKLEYFYMEGCPHCVEFDPTWAQLEKVLSSGIKPFKYEVSSNEGRPRANLFKVSSAPTILLTENDKVIKEYTGARDLQSIMAFLSS